jgi:raffinose/stachyose/melibiose transport system permease protein
MTAHSARRARRVNIGLVLQFMIALVFAAIILVPLATAVINGFKTNAELLLSPFSLPEMAQVQNYTEVLSSNVFWRMLFNSLLVMVLTMFGVISLGAMAAYVFARLQFRGRELLYNFFTLGMLFPLAVAILPLYLTIRDVGLVDTYWGIILPQVAFGLPGTIVVLRGFFAQVPKEIEESAAIDGASIMRTFFFIVLPIMRPALAAVAVIGMVGSWNAFFWPLLVINTETLYTLPLGVMQFSTQYSTDYGRVLAFITISMIPAIAFYLIAERQIVAGLTAGAVKG